MPRIPTAPVAAGSLVAGYAVAVASGSRPLGGVVLVLGGLWCVRTWAQRHGQRMALTLASVGLCSFIVSHVLALALGGWPSVVLVAAFTGAVVWMRADLRAQDAAGPLAFRPPAR